MAEVYDNWERLVAATLKREEYRELARAPSMETSFSSSISGRFNAPFNFKFKSAVNHESGESYFFKTILLADQLVQFSNKTTSFRRECLGITSKAEKVALLLRGAEHANQKIYDRPTRYVMSVVENVLKNAISLVLKCRGLKGMFATVNSASFDDISSQLEHSIGNICWLFRDDQYGAIPAIAADEPILFNIWELIAILHTGLVEDRCNAMASIVSLVHESDAYRKLIVEEGCGIKPLLRLVEDGTPEAQENAVMVLASLVSLALEQDVYRKLIIEEGYEIEPLLRLVGKGKPQVQENAVTAIASLISLTRESDIYIKLIIEEGEIKTLLKLVKEGTLEVQENAMAIIALTGKENWGLIGFKVCSVFLGILKEDPPKQLQGTMAWALSELAEILYHYEVNFVHVLINLTLKTFPKDIKVDLDCGVDGVGRETRENNLDDDKSNISPFRVPKMKDDEIDDYIQATTSRALWHLAKSWPLITSEINAKLALCFAFFLHRGSKKARYNYVMALMEITTLAESDITTVNELPIDNVVVDQLLRIIDKEEIEILIPCIKVIGNLAWTFSIPRSRIIGLLVRMLDGRDIEVSREACVALIKFVSDNFRHVNHSKAIINAKGLKPLIQHVYSKSEIVQPFALKLLCYIALSAPSRIQLVEAKVLSVLEWALEQSSSIQVEEDIKLLILRTLEENSGLWHLMK